MYTRLPQQVWDCRLQQSRLSHCPVDSHTAFITTFFQQNPDFLTLLGVSKGARAHLRSGYAAGRERSRKTHPLRSWVQQLQRGQMRYGRHAIIRGTYRCARKNARARAVSARVRCEPRCPVHIIATRSTCPLRDLSLCAACCSRMHNVCAMSCGGVHVYTSAGSPHMWPHPLASLLANCGSWLVHTLEECVHAAPEPLDMHSPRARKERNATQS